LPRPSTSFTWNRSGARRNRFFKRPSPSIPGHPFAQVYYGLFLAAAEDAAKQARVACELDPLSPIIFGHASSTLCAIGNFEAAETYDRSLDLFVAPPEIAHNCTGISEDRSAEPTQYRWLIANRRRSVKSDSPHLISCSGSYAGAAASHHPNTSR
jgi:hypothetical protein